MGNRGAYAEVKGEQGEDDVWGCDESDLYARLVTVCIYLCKFVFNSYYISCYCKI